MTPSIIRPIYRGIAAEFKVEVDCLLAGMFTSSKLNTLRVASSVWQAESDDDLKTFGCGRGRKNTGLAGGEWVLLAELGDVSRHTTGLRANADGRSESESKNRVNTAFAVFFETIINLLTRPKRVNSYW